LGVSSSDADAKKRESLKVLLRSAVGSSTSNPDGKRESLKELIRTESAHFKEVQEQLLDNSTSPASPSGSNKEAGEKVGELLEAESFVARETELNEELVASRERIIAAVKELSEMNPTAAPFNGWRCFAGADPSECKLGGTWKLLWSNAADATFRRGESGKATVFQVIDPEKGTFTNAVNFDGQGKLRGFRVVIEGEVENANEVQLLFRKVRLFRRSRFPKLFGRVTIPLPPPKLLRWLGRRASRGKAKLSDRGAGFSMLYLDDDFRMHQTFDGLYYVQQRLEKEPELLP